MTRKSKGKHFVSLFNDKNTAICFNSFWTEYIHWEIKQNQR